MGKYLSFANGCIQKFKPIIEERTGTKLENIIAKEESEYPGFAPEYHKNTGMFVCSKNYPDAIFVHETIYDKNKNLLGTIPREITHELAHLVHRKIIYNLKETNPREDISRLVKRYKKSKSFREGFAEYISLNYLADLYDNQTLKRVWGDLGWRASYLNFSPKFIPYERGYKFFRKVLSVVGKDKIFEVARSPPISEIEVKIPLLYLLRRYPAQGVKNIPKFFTRSIKTKIFKKKYGYAPFDFDVLDYRAPSMTPCSVYCQKSLKLLSSWKEALEKYDQEAAEALKSFNKDGYYIRKLNGVLKNERLLEAIK